MAPAEPPYYLAAETPPELNIRFSSSFFYKQKAPAGANSYNAGSGRSLLFVEKYNN
jgi:hypothetical protein